MKTLWGAKVQLTSFLTLTLNGGDEWSTSRPGRFTRGEKCRYPMNGGGGGIVDPQSLSGRLAEKKISCPSPDCSARSKQYMQRRNNLVSEHCGSTPLVSASDQHKHRPLYILTTQLPKNLTMTTGWKARV
jgi:hypothetical protein